MSDKYILILGGTPVLMALGASLDSSILSEANVLIQEISSINFLGYLGIILTLSIGLLVQLFFWVDKAEYSLDRSTKKEIRTEIRSTAKHLVAIFGFSTVVVLTKSILAANSVIWLALSGVQIWLILFYILILYDVVMSVFEFDI